MVTHNIGPNRPTDTGDDWNVVVGGTSQYRTNTPPFALSGIVEDDVTTVQSKVLASTGAGAIIPSRDSLDAATINDVINGTGTIYGTITYPTPDTGTPPVDTDGDGMPDAWESANGTNPSVHDANGDVDGDGYTNIEEYINSFVPASGSPPPPTGLIPNPPSLIGIE
jgi:hypothetical protein